jgi:PadR family transcriptional regulator PadR
MFHGKRDESRIRLNSRAEPVALRHWISESAIPMSDETLNLLQGTLDILVLRSLLTGPLHGYGVARWIRETSEDALRIEEGALYTALHRMEKRKWLESEWGLSENNRKAKYYSLTERGRRELDEGALSWTRYAEAVFKILGAREKEAAS